MVTGNIIKCSDTDKHDMEKEIVKEAKMLRRMTKKKRINKKEKKLSKEKTKKRKRKRETRGIEKGERNRKLKGKRKHYWITV